MSGSLKIFVNLRQISLAHDTYLFCGETTPIPFEFNVPCGFDSQNQTIHGTEPLVLSAGRRYRSSMRLSVWSQTTKTRVATVTLPLYWFPADQVVTDWFPFQPPAETGGASPLALLDVHIAKRFALARFTAPIGRLLVLPAWNRPHQPALPPAHHFPPTPGYQALTIPRQPYPAPTEGQPQLLPVPVVVGDPSYPAPPSAYPPMPAAYPAPPQGIGYPSPDQSLCCVSVGYTMEPMQFGDSATWPTADLVMDEPNPYAQIYDTASEPPAYPTI
jgi:hypothetical protein